MNSTKEQGVLNHGHTLQHNKIATLWLQLSDIYGPLFINKYGEKDSGVWYQTLHDLTDADILFGLHAMLRDTRFETWPPNCTQFRHLCIRRSEGISLPSVHQAFNEARENLVFTTPRRWSHPAVKFTVKYVGLEQVNSADKHSAFQDFTTAYEKICARIALGHEVPHVNDEELIIRPKKSGLAIPKLSQFISQCP